MACASGEELARFVDGEGEGFERAGIVGHLPVCARCRETVRELREIVGDLARDPELPAVDLAPLVLYRAALPPPRRPAFRMRMLAAAAAAAGLVAGVGLERHRAAPVADSDMRGFQARGGSDSPDKWVAIHPYVVGADNRPRALGLDTPVRCGERLLFAYDNGGTNPYRYLIIVAARDGRAPLWFYPDGKEPHGASIPIEPGINRELHEEIAAFNCGSGVNLARRTLWGIFSHDPLSTRAIESQLSANTERLSIADTGQHRLGVRFEEGSYGD